MSTQYSLSNHDQVQILSVNNLLNEYENKKILSVALSKIDEGFPNFVVDLSNIEFMNSVGLNFLLALKSKTKDSGGKLAVANASKRIVDLLEMTKLLKMFRLVDSIEAGVQSFSQYEN